MVRAAVDGFDRTFQVVNKRADNGLVELLAPNNTSTWYCDPRLVTILDGTPQAERPGIGGTRRKLLNALLYSPLTDQALSERALVRNVTYTAHMRSELVTAGLVADSGRRAVSESGARLIVWMITDLGRKELDRPA